MVELRKPEPELVAGELPARREVAGGRERIQGVDAAAEVVGRPLRVEPAVAVLPVRETLEHTRGDAFGESVQDAFRELDREDGHLALRPPCPLSRTGSWRAPAYPRALRPRAVGLRSQPPSARGRRHCPAPTHGCWIRASPSPLCGRRRAWRHRCLPGRVPPLGRDSAPRPGVERREPRRRGPFERASSARLRLSRLYRAPPGPNEEAETAWALTSPELHQLLTRVRGWETPPLPGLACRQPRAATPATHQPTLTPTRLRVAQAD